MRDHTIARAAEDLYTMLDTLVGPTKDWPIDIAVDDPKVAQELIAKLNALGQAIDPKGRTAFTGVQ